MMPAKFAFLRGARKLPRLIAVLSDPVQPSTTINRSCHLSPLLSPLPSTHPYATLHSTCFPNHDTKQQHLCTYRRSSYWSDIVASSIDLIDWSRQPTASFLPQVDFMARSTKPIKLNHAELWYLPTYEYQTTYVGDRESFRNEWSVIRNDITLNKVIERAVSYMPWR